MSLHHVLGVPEVAPLTPAQEEQARSMLGVEVQATDASPAEVNAFAAAWRSAARFYWAQAYVAMGERDFRLMRTAADQAVQADQAVSPEGMLMAGIFGALALPPERVVTIGGRMSDDNITVARDAVKAEMARYASTKVVQRPQVKKPVQGLKTPAEGTTGAVIVKYLQDNGAATAGEITVACGLETRSVYAAETSGFIRSLRGDKYGV